MSDLKQYVIPINETINFKDSYLKKSKYYSFNNNADYSGGNYQWTGFNFKYTSNLSKFSGAPTFDIYEPMYSDYRGFMYPLKLRDGLFKSIETDLKPGDWIDIPATSIGLRIEVDNLTGTPTTNNKRGNSFFSYRTLKGSMIGCKIIDGEETDLGTDYTNSSLPDRGWLDVTSGNPRQSAYYEYDTGQSRYDPTLRGSFNYTNFTGGENLSYQQEIRNKTFLYKWGKYPDTYKENTQFNSVRHKKQVFDLIHTIRAYQWYYGNAWYGHYYVYHYLYGQQPPVTQVPGKHYLVNNGCIIENIKFTEGEDIQIFSVNELTIKDVVIENGKSLILSNCSNVKIKNLKVINKVEGSTSVILKGCHQVIIENCTFYNGDINSTAVKIINGRNIVFKKNVVSNYGTAIDLTECVYNDFVITLNKFSGINDIIKYNENTDILNVVFTGNIYSNQKVNNLRASESIVVNSNESLEGIIGDDINVDVWKVVSKSEGLRVNPTGYIKIVNQYLSFIPTMTLFYNFNINTLNTEQVLINCDNVLSLYINNLNELFIKINDTCIYKCINPVFKINRTNRLAVLFNLTDGILKIYLNSYQLSLTNVSGSIPNSFNSLTSEMFVGSNGIDKELNGYSSYLAIINELLSDLDIKTESVKYPNNLDKRHNYLLKINFNSRKSNDYEGGYEVLTTNTTYENNIIEINNKGLISNNTSMVLSRNDLNIVNYFFDKSIINFQLSVITKAKGGAVNCDYYDNVDWDNAKFRLLTGINSYYEWTLSECKDNKEYILKFIDAVSNNNNNSLITGFEINIPLINPVIPTYIMIGSIYLNNSENISSLKEKNIVKHAANLNINHFDKGLQINNSYSGLVKDIKNINIIANGIEITKDNNKAILDGSIELSKEYLGTKSKLDKKVDLIENINEGSLIIEPEKVYLSNDLIIKDSFNLNSIKTPRKLHLIGFKRRKQVSLNDYNDYTLDKELYEIKEAYYANLKIYHNFKERSGLTALDQFDYKMPGVYTNEPVYLNNDFHRSGIKLTNNNMIYYDINNPDYLTNWINKWYTIGGFPFPYAVTGLTIILIGKFNTPINNVEALGVKLNNKYPTPYSFTKGLNVYGTTDTLPTEYEASYGESGGFGWAIEDRSRFKAVLVDNRTPNGFVQNPFYKAEIVSNDFTFPSGISGLGFSVKTDGLVAEKKLHFVVNENTVNWSSVSGTDDYHKLFPSIYINNIQTHNVMSSGYSTPASVLSLGNWFANPTFGLEADLYRTIILGQYMTETRIKEVIEKYRYYLGD